MKNLVALMARKANAIICFLFIAGVVEIFCISMKIGIPILSPEFAIVVLNLSYSYVAGYIFYFFALKIPEIRDKPYRLRLGYYYIFTLLNNVDHIYKQFEVRGEINSENFEHISPDMKKLFRFRLALVNTQRSLLNNYINFVDPKTMLRTDEIVRHLNNFLFQDEVEVEGGNSYYNAELLKQVRIHALNIRRDDSKNISLAEERITKEIVD